MREHFMKITYNDKDVSIAWFTIAGDDEVHHEITSQDAPERSLDEALQAFTPEIVSMLGLPKEYLQLEVTSLSIRHDKGKRGLVVTGKQKIDGLPSPFVIHTPYVREAAAAEDGAGADATPPLVVKLFELLDKAEIQAQRFLEGKRSQGDLFEDVVAHVEATEEEEEVEEVPA